MMFLSFLTENMQLIFLMLLIIKNEKEACESFLIVFSYVYCLKQSQEISSVSNNNIIILLYRIK